MPSLKVRSLTIKERTSPKKLLEELYEKSVENLYKCEELPNEIEIIDNVIMSSYSFKDYETFEIGIEKLGSIGIKPNNISGVPIVLKIFGKIRDIGLATIDDPRAPIIVVRIFIKMGTEIETKLETSTIFTAIQISIISGLEYICYEATIKKNIMAQSLVDMTLSNIGEFGINAASMKNNTVAISAALRLKNIGITAKENNMDSMVKSAARRLWILSAAVVKDLPFEVNRLIQILSSFRSSVTDNYIDAGFEEAERDIRNTHPNLEPYLLEVKNILYGNKM